MVMEDKKQYRDAVDDFAAQLYRKGYRRRYKLDRTATDKILFTGTLSECLDQLYNISRPKEGQALVFELSTRPPYGDKLDCRFDMAYEPVKGFRIRSMDIRDTLSGESRRYSITNNHQIPGSQAVLALFPKPKPWDRHLKGKFRP